MSNLHGFGDWPQELLKHAPWLLDRHLFAIFEAAAGGVSASRSGGAGIVQTIDGRASVQGFYRSAGQSLRQNHLSMTPSIIVAEQLDWVTCLRAASIPAGVEFCPYLWDLETFDVVDAGVYTLARPHAAGLVPGVTLATHPPLLILDGVETPAAATVVGATVTAAATGRLAVYYMPLYAVLVTTLAEAVSVYPVMQATISIEEVD